MSTLITGATSGIGRVAALELARKGEHVIVHGRNQQRAEETGSMILERIPNARVDIVLADLSAQADVRRLAAEVRERFPDLRVLVNNAGGTFSPRQETTDGIELTLALNHLAPFLLTNLLLDRLTANAPARIVTVSSDAHNRAALDFDDLQNRRRYRGFRVYGQSKLCNLYFTYALARRLEGSGVTANALHPGFVATNFGRSNSGWLGVVMPLAHRFAISPQAGARTIIYLAAADDVANISGKYFYKERPIASSRMSYDTAAAERLWTMSAELTGLSR